MSKVFLHIGFEKTGTTSLQEFMRRNRSLLLKQKVLYPLTPGESNHHRLVAYSIDKPEKINDLIIVNKLPNLWDNETNRTAFIQELSKEVYHSGNVPDTLVFSNEHCSSRLTTDREISRIKDLMNKVLGQADIKVIMYLRRQDDFIISNYTTLVMNGYTGSFDHYFEKSVDDYLIQYLSIIKNWQEVFGKENLMVRAYQRGTNHNNATIRDFLQLAQIRNENSFSYPGILNRSLDVYCLDFLRNFNSRIPYIKEDQHNSKERGNIVELLSEMSGDQKLKCSFDQFSILKEKFNGQNQQIINDYNVEDGQHLSFEQTETPWRDSFEATSSESMEAHFDIFTKLWAEKQHRINNLKKELDHIDHRLKKSEAPDKKGIQKIIEKWYKRK